MKIDPITQYILEADVQGARDTVNRVGSAMAAGTRNKAAKVGNYVASTYRAKVYKGLAHDKCTQLQDIANKFGRAGGKCNGAKFEYYKILTRICTDGHKLQDLLYNLNKRFARSKTKAAWKEEADLVKNRLLSAKEKLTQTKALMDEVCRDEIEQSIEDRAKKQEVAKRKKERLMKMKKLAQKKIG